MCSLQTRSLRSEWLDKKDNTVVNTVLNTGLDPCYQVTQCTPKMRAAAPQCAEITEFLKCLSLQDWRGHFEAAEREGKWKEEEEKAEASLGLMSPGVAIHHFIICPIAIAYSMGQIIKSVCACQSVSVSVCQCVYLSVCEHSHGRIS